MGDGRIPRKRRFTMNRLAKIAAAAVIALGAGTVSAAAACNGDASTETVLGAGSGALVGGLASHSIVGAAVGGVAGGLIGNTIGHSNNRSDCRRAARAHSNHRERDSYYLDREGRRHYY
jgi:outer membrane lipoprotein SlyB